MRIHGLAFMGDGSNGKSVVSLQHNDVCGTWPGSEYSAMADVIPHALSSLPI